MRIRQNLPQFEGQPSLLVVTGRMSAIFYHALEGNIEEIARLEESPDYFSDNEGHFATRTSGIGQGKKTIRSGSVREPYDDKRVARFMRQLREKMWTSVRELEIKDVYMFTPKEHEIISQLQQRVRQKIRKVIKGDVMHEHPFSLLERLQAAMNERI